MRYVEPLTRRELECLYQAAYDKSCRETAEALFISLETVKTHRSVILRKLGCRTITGALMVAMRKGLIIGKDSGIYKS